MGKTIDRFESMVSFRTSQGERGQGSLIHLTRNAAVFSVYNPFSLVQLSEVLSEIKIMRGSRTIYDGTAVIANITGTGLYDIVTASLRDAWKDLQAPIPGPELQKEVALFLEEWKQSIQISPPYRIAVNNLKDFFSSLNQWTNELEMAVGIENLQQRPQLQREFCEDIEASLNATIYPLMETLERVGKRIEYSSLATHKAFAQRELHALILCAPFCHRTYTKPLGYAGDYEMVNMLLREPWEGANTYAKLVNVLLIESDTGKAHRNRVKILEENLKNEAKRIAEQGRRCKILNIGCGPAAEIGNFIHNEEICNICDFMLIDFNKETLDYTNKQLKAAKARKGRGGITIHCEHKSISDILRISSERKKLIQPSYDFVYCAGLFDYLKTQVCKRVTKLLYNYTLPGGLTLMTNVHTKHTVKIFLEHLLEWYLILRNDEDMLGLAPEGSCAELEKDVTEVNIFLKLRRALS